VIIRVARSSPAADHIAAWTATVTKVDVTPEEIVAAVAVRSWGEVKGLQARYGCERIQIPPDLMREMLEAGVGPRAQIESPGR
jgi:hypothetical protein